MRVTKAKINEALKIAGIDAEIFRDSSGYFYFSGPSMDLVECQGVYVFKILQLSVEEWVEEARQKIKGL